MLFVDKASTPVFFIDNRFRRLKVLSKTKFDDIEKVAPVS